MLNEFLNQVCEWAANEPRIGAVALIGSYARGAQRPDSDVDLILITSDKQSFIDDPEVFRAFGEIERYEIEDYGECTSIRVRYRSGLEVEFGMVPYKWIEMPLNKGTERCLDGGCRILMDKKGLFEPISAIIPELI